MSVSCTDDLKNLGVSRCKKRPGFLKGMITTPNSFTITAANAATQSNWQDAILAASNTRIYLWPGAVSYENISEEQILEETPLTTIGVRPGNYRLRYYFKENLEMHKRMHSHNEFDGRVFLVDIDNKIIGTSDDDGVTLKGFSLDNLIVEKLMLNTGTEATKTPVSLYMSDNTELDDRGFMVEASFFNSLVSLTSVTMTEVGTSSSSTITVDVASALDGVPIIGLAAADFVKLSSAGASESISGIVESSDGRYVLSATTTFSTGTVGLVTPATLTLTGYELDTVLSVTI